MAFSTRKATSSYLFKQSWKRQLVGFIDFLGCCLVRTHDLIDNDTKPRNFTKILVIRLDHIGDFILTLPAFERLRDHFPCAQIDLLTDSSLESLSKKWALFDHIFSLETHWFTRKSSFLSKLQAFLKFRRVIKKGEYQLAIDFRGDFRNLLLFAFSGIPFRLGYPHTGGAFLLSELKEVNSRQHQSLINLDLISSLVGDAGNSVELKSLPSLNGSTALDKSQFADEIIAIHPGAGYPEKIWPENNFKRLIALLQERYPSSLIILLGTSLEKQLSEIQENSTFHNLRDLRGQTEIDDLLFLFSKKTILFIGNDSGIGHIASLYNIPMVCIFSDMNDPNRWKPLSKKLYLITGDVKKISVETVMESCIQALENIDEKK